MTWGTPRPSCAGSSKARRGFDGGGLRGVVLDLIQRRLQHRRDIAAVRAHRGKPFLRPAELLLSVRDREVLVVDGAGVRRDGHRDVWSQVDHDGLAGVDEGDVPRGAMGIVVSLASARSTVSQVSRR